MAVQVVNGYAFNVKRISLTPVQAPNNAGMAAYEGDQVFVIASSLQNAQAVLAAQYGADLGVVSGGATPIYAALTTMTGS